MKVVILLPWCKTTMTITSDAYIPVVIDCDPGNDDMFALIWTLIMHKKGFIDVKAITTSGGNVAAQATFDNAIRATMITGTEGIKIWKGKNKEGSDDASYIHGNDGIGGLSSLLPPVKIEQEYNSEQLLIDALNEYEGELFILATGPLSNLAKIEEKHPGILKKAKRIISMGGVFNRHGNVTPVAEFNYRYDPESAKVVMDSKAELVIVPLNITESFVFGVDNLEPILWSIDHQEHRDFLYKLTEFTTSTSKWFRETHYHEGFFVHDASTIAFLIYPHMYSGSYYKVDIETKGEFTRGMSIIDVRNHAHLHANAYVLTDVDRDEFMESITEDFKDFDFKRKE